MIPPRIWERCIHHRGENALAFSDEYFSQDGRNVLLIGGAGFDPRSHYVASKLSKYCKCISGHFIRENRPNAAADLHQKAKKNDEFIRTLIPTAEISPLDVFDIDNAPIGGPRVIALINDKIDLSNITDLVLDCSAISTGLMFPLARYFWESAKRIGPKFNFHLMVLDDPTTDAAIQSVSCGKASAFHTFAGGLTLDQNNDSAKLWLPQLGAGRREFLNQIYQEILPHSVCPILPFPSVDPRTGDRLIQEYGDLFESRTGAMTVTWDVDSRDIVYAHEKNPLDLYRAVLRIADARHRVFASTGGSQLILSPLGSKAVSIGLLMAALERDFAVVSVESIGYNFTPVDSVISDSAELVHLWLHGQAYSYEQSTEGSN